MYAHARDGEPTPAQRVRSVVEAADSLTVTTDGHSIGLVGLHTVDAAGGLTLHDPPGEHLGAELDAALDGTLPAVVEFTDVAPVHLRDRVRARLSLHGWLGTAADRGLHLHTEYAVLAEHGRSRRIGVDELVRAQPDPLARAEAELLSHLDCAHDAMVRALARLAPADVRAAAVRVRPARLDQYGITLRFEHAGRSHQEVRLGFGRAVRYPEEVGEEIRGLVVGRV
ncbi:MULTISPECIES: DUF2470 domain-containing protein [Streptomyces]|uniref:DUF2470 domain-containing protein n=1 Tax=Streptomyces rutgersensis TaxID=53451 RepID=A0ABX6RL02_9ACTN|nr:MULTISPECIES: DUF2470 domain-containing protein [Streptomyces]NEE48795.1 DUF2470 domain-containing protein [Streptomyces sp. SID8455]WSU37959.1 DUF2470 domain-containing protein [Streptomyces gougerotii]NEC15628.1 DUF2470 domain-containing protein [Streptomyces sp. SID8014]QNE81056.1 DUF2470 domain-containing protein [Streptomyces rutgersensis]GFH65888.1 hypothetical protein Srut_24020 [Streptomyces rutgersensis]